LFKLHGQSFVRNVKVDDRQLSQNVGKLIEDLIKNIEVLMKILFSLIYQLVMKYEVTRLHDGH